MPVSQVYRRVEQSLNSTFRKAIAAALLLMMTAGACAETLLVTEDTKVYQKPSKSAKSISIDAGTMLDATDKDDGWYRVEKGGNVAYIRSGDVVKVKEYDGVTGYVTDDSPLYKAYGSSKKHCTVEEGEKVKVYAVAGDMAYVKYDGKKGYMDMDDLSNKAPEKEKEPEEPKTEEKKEEKKEDDGIVYLDDVTGYARDGAKVYKSNSTSSDLLGKLEENDTVTVDAVKDGWCRVKKGGKTGFMKMEDLSTSRIESEAKEEEKAEEEKKEEENNDRVRNADWWTSDIQSVFARGVTATITDVKTGISWKEIRKGGTNHADVQPVSAEDTAKLKKVYGGVWSWNRRAIWVTINGVTYAASMNGMPHGSDSVANNDFDGHHCIHFTNSRTHSGNRLDSDHQAMVKSAYKAGNK